MKRAVVSFADSGKNGYYLNKLERLKETARTHGVETLTFTDYAQINCEHHNDIPYKFKAKAIEKAILMGYDSIIWADSPIKVTKDLTPVFEHIEAHGYLFFDNIGHPLGKWTNQKCLDYFSMTREEAMNVQMIMACCMGFDLTNENVREWLKDYIGLADMLYPGSWSDHRHDQTVASFLIHRDCMKITNGQSTFFTYSSHRGIVPINEATICLESD